MCKWVSNECQSTAFNLLSLAFKQPQEGISAHETSTHASNTFVKQRRTNLEVPHYFLRNEEKASRALRGNSLVFIGQGMHAHEVQFYISIRQVWSFV